MTQLLLIRHGQSANNALPEHQRVCDPDLTDLGRQQAQLTADALRSTHLSHLYCSPFRRSLDTMRPIAETRSNPVSIRGDLFEQGGCYSGHLPGHRVGEPGMGSVELASQYPQWTLDERIGSEGWWGRPYESMDQAAERARRVVLWMRREIVPLGGVHAFVIHADFKRLLLLALFEQHASALSQMIGPLHNVGITRINWERNAWQLGTLNATTHLPFECIT